MDYKSIYNNKDYYEEHLGIDYHDKKEWEPLFKRFAKKIVEDIHPKTVLDVGCAFGYIVEFLRGYGVEAWGIDVSEYAIGEADEKIKPYLRVCSALEPLPNDMPKKYDLVLNIEVLEHLTEEDGMKAMQRICSYGDKLIFSSASDSDAYEEESHLNVQPLNYWASKLEQYGFYRELFYDMSYLSEYAGLYIKKQKNIEELISDYEKKIWEIDQKYKNEQKTCYNVLQDAKKFLEEKERLKTDINTLKNSRAYKVSVLGTKMVNNILPKQSTRRKIVGKIGRKTFKVLRKTKNSLINKNQEFYSKEELERQLWCKNHPLKGEIKFSIVVPLFNTANFLLEQLITSVQNQIYTNWELCLVDASDNSKKLNRTVEKFAKNDKRIKYKMIEGNKGISGNTKEAIKLATGDFIALLDHDDIIAPNALYEYKLSLEENPDTIMFYSDKDMIDKKGTHRFNPFYKPKYSPEMMLSANYMTHFSVIKRTALEKTKGYDSLVDGAQDWDIFLKIMEITDNIIHIPQILYHWRVIETSVASGSQAKPYVFNAQLKVLNSYLENKKIDGEIIFDKDEKRYLRVNLKNIDITKIKIIMLSSSGKEKVNLEEKYRYTILKKSQEEKINEEIQKLNKEDVLILIDTDECTKISSDLISELSSWAVLPEIGIVSPMIIKDEKIKSCGLMYEQDVIDCFAEKDIDSYECIGSTLWYRNFNLFRGTCIAVQGKKLEGCKYNFKLGTLAFTYNCFKINKKGYRHVYIPFAQAFVSPLFSSITQINSDFAYLKNKFDIPRQDKFYIKAYKESISQSNISNTLDQYTSDAMIFSKIYDFSNKDLVENEKIVKNDKKTTIETMIWFLPEFDYVFYAGLYTIFRTAEYLRENYKIKHSFAFLSSLDAEVMLSRIGMAFPELAKCNGYSLREYSDLGKIGSYDASVCTLWTTAYYSLKMNQVKRKFYFIQDYEPLFYPAGTTYAQVQATYRFGFYGIINTIGLCNVYKKEFNGIGVALNPSIDTNIFYPNINKVYNKEPFLVFFYGRPGHYRNGFELGINALKKLKELLGNKVRIVTAGANYDISRYGLEGVVENLGRLKIEETGDLYRKCDVGLVMMFTRHPSYLPYEMMACGCTVVSNYNEYTKWFLKHNENCIIAENSATVIAESIKNILYDFPKRQKISEYASKQLLENNPTWNESIEKIGEFVKDTHIFERKGNKYD